MKGGIIPDELFGKDGLQVGPGKSLDKQVVRNIKRIVPIFKKPMGEGIRKDREGQDAQGHKPDPEKQLRLCLGFAFICQCHKERASFMT